MPTTRPYRRTSLLLKGCTPGILTLEQQGALSYALQGAHLPQEAVLLLFFRGQPPIRAAAARGSLPACSIDDWQGAALCSAGQIHAQAQAAGFDVSAACRQYWEAPPHTASPHAAAEAGSISPQAGHPHAVPGEGRTVAQEASEARIPAPASAAQDEAIGADPLPPIAAGVPVASQGVPIMEGTAPTTACRAFPISQGIPSMEDASPAAGASAASSQGTAETDTHATSSREEATAQREDFAQAPAAPTPQFGAHRAFAAPQGAPATEDSTPVAAHRAFPISQDILATEDASPAAEALAASPCAASAAPLPDPFGGRIKNAVWKRISYPYFANGSHYLSGEILCEGRTAVRLLAIPGEYAVSPPAWLAGFDCFWQSPLSRQGYWLFACDSATGQPISIRSLCVYPAPGGCPPAASAPPGRHSSSAASAPPPAPR